MGSQWKAGKDFQPPPDWDAGFEFNGRDGGAGNSAEFSEFFESLFGSRGGRTNTRQQSGHAQGEDHHAKVLIDFQDAYRGAQRNISLQMPALDTEGHMVVRERMLNVSIPKGVREGQHLRLGGQGAPALVREREVIFILKSHSARHRVFGSMAAMFTWTCPFRLGRRRWAPRSRRRPLTALCDSRSRRDG